MNELFELAHSPQVAEVTGKNYRECSVLDLADAISQVADQKVKHTELRKALHLAGLEEQGGKLILTAAKKKEIDAHVAQIDKDRKQQEIDRKAKIAQAEKEAKEAEEAARQEAAIKEARAKQKAQRIKRAAIQAEQRAQARAKAQQEREAEAQRLLEASRPSAIIERERGRIAVEVARDKRKAEALAEEFDVDLSRASAVERAIDRRLAYLESRKLAPSMDDDVVKGLLQLF